MARLVIAKRNREWYIFLGLICIGILFRFAVMTIGHNFDFESYCIVGEISGNLRNVYAETGRYNYAPVFLCIQGLLYRISQIGGGQWISLYRVLIVSTLTAADLGITFFIAKKYSYVAAILFFLNPISIIITGYHNQFDNIAILFALISIVYFNNDKKFNKKDIGFIVWFSMSLLTKHILVFLPIFILLLKNLPIKKKIVYAFVPPMIFLISFIPFALASREAFEGIIKNVFMYRSFNNAPILQLFYNLIGFPLWPRIIVYGVLMAALAWIVRGYRYEQILLIYFIAMVAFSSAIANQYLVIPMVALCVFNVWKWDWIYMGATSAYLLIDYNGFNIISIIEAQLPGSILYKLCAGYYLYGYIMAVWILAFAIIQLVRLNLKAKEVIIYGKRLPLWGMFGDKPFSDKNNNRRIKC